MQRLVPPWLRARSYTPHALHAIHPTPTHTYTIHTQTHADARADILKIHSRKMNLTRGINLRVIAEMMPGASGAEVKGVCTEAGMYALRERRVHVTQEDFELAVAKIMQKDSEKNMSIKKLWK